MKFISIQQLNPLQIRTSRWIYVTLSRLFLEALELQLVSQPLRPHHPHPCAPPSLAAPPCQTALRQHNSLFARTTTVAIGCCQADPSETGLAWPASAANLLSKGQEGPSLARCLMGSDSSVFWDYTR